MYSLSAYGRMVADEPRMGAYLAAMQRVIQPGSIVVDLGAGPGVMALHACRLGAARVYAIEPDDNIAIAAELAAANGMADRIALAQQYAERLDLPERVDVIVSDLRGAVPLHGAHPAVIVNVRERWLKPGGTLIPMRDTVQASLVRSGPHYDGIVEPWRPQAGLDLSPALKWALGGPKKARFDADDLVTPPRAWAVLDYRTIVARDVVAGEVSWEVGAPATACGMALWTDAELLDGIGFSNAPGPRAAIHGQMFLPWSRPVELGAGDRVTAALTATSTSRGYLWSWNTRIAGADGTVRESFDQGGPGSVPTGLRQFAARGRPA
jgi:protein arginine N-methyltransferase 1